MATRRLVRFLKLALTGKKADPMHSAVRQAEKAIKRSQKAIKRAEKELSLGYVQMSAAVAKCFV